MYQVLRIVWLAGTFHVTVVILSLKVCALFSKIASGFAVQIVWIHQARFINAHRYSFVTRLKFSHFDNLLPHFLLFDTAVLEALLRLIPRTSLFLNHETLFFYSFPLRHAYDEFLC